MRKDREYPGVLPHSAHPISPTSRDGLQFGARNGGKKFLGLESAPFTPSLSLPTVVTQSCSTPSPFSPWRDAGPLCDV